MEQKIYSMHDGKKLPWGSKCREFSCQKFKNSPDVLTFRNDLQRLPLILSATAVAKYKSLVFTARCTMHSAKRGLAIACRLSVCLSVCPSVTLVICDHIGWKSWKLTARTISPAPSLFVARRRSTYSQGEHGEIWGRLEVG